MEYSTFTELLSFMLLGVLLLNGGRREMTTATVAPGDTVPVSDGTVTVKTVSTGSVTYHHPDWGTNYTISMDSFTDYMDGDG